MKNKIDRFFLFVNLLKDILCIEVRESHLLYVYIYVLVYLFLKNFFASTPIKHE